MDLTYGYLISPGRCFSCASSTPGQPTIDLGDIPAMGSRRLRLYMCCNCVAAAAKIVSGTIGKELVSVEELADLRDRAGQADAWEARGIELEDQMRSIATFAAHRESA